MTLTAGTRLGPYEIVEPLGAGGMGEVYRARDPRLGRDVAVKLVTTDGTPSPDRLRRFETEARAAAQLSHPNVITVFDVGTHNGQPYLVLELLEGKTLRETLRGAAPSLREAVGWGLETARGLGAAHERGIVHRDLKPENLFLTEDGRVKVLDFGLAKLHESLVEEPDRESPTETRGTKPGMVLGTVGYMAPEQVRGEAPDARTDVFALGTVLYELVTRRRPFGGSSEGEVLAAILRDDPPAPSSIHSAIPPALDGVVRRCLAKAPSERFASAREVGAALETVLASLGSGRSATARPPELRGPYPGLESFRESDTERFFGREAEVEALWAKLHERRLLAVIGPSGVGKTSFMRAGVLASRPTGWAAIVCAPAANPFRRLGQALAPELADDPEALGQLLGFEEMDTAVALLGRWRRAHGEALVVVDQLEELFTLSPEEEQARFAELIGRVSTEADAHVVLSMRDDFLMRCSEHDALARVFTELTPLRPLSGDALRRALVEPAKREGFSFEEGLVEEMLQAVEGARGALPLLAFAVSRLWQKRDREAKLLTRAAYEEIGGVAGALAQHAEATLERIGEARQPLVREIFRNLVTAQGTRASCERAELLSAFPEPAAAETALEELIDARLLTSYEVEAPLSHAERGDAGSPASSHPERGDVRDRAKNLADGRSWGSSAPEARQYRIEIVHESLLKAWPRLVWWQAQDEEGAQLRDQLRQAARLWEEKGRSEDLLWSGTAEREFEVWRERYPGQLTAVEDDFARAMVERAQRARRFRRIAVASIIAVALAVAAVTATLWWRGDQARVRALMEARRAEASQLRALGTQHLQRDPSAALAYAIAALERFDSPAGRRFALAALAAGPPALFADVNPTRPTSLEFSPNGEWLGAAGCFGARLLPRDGGAATVLDDEGYQGECSRRLHFAADGDHVALSPSDQRVVRIWSLSKGAEVKRFEWEGMAFPSFVGNRLLMDTVVQGRPVIVRVYDLDSGELEILERWDARGVQWWEVDPGGRRVALARVDDKRVFVRPFWGHEPTVERVVGRHATPARFGAPSPEGHRLASVDESGEIRVWSLDGGKEKPLRALRAEGWVEGLSVDPSGAKLAVGYTSDEGLNNLVRVWDLEGPEGAAPVELRTAMYGQPFPAAAFHPTSRLAAVAYLEALGIFSLERSVYVLPGQGNLGADVAFTPDSQSLVAGYEDGPLLRVWDLDGDGQRNLNRWGGAVKHIAVDPGGRHVVVAGLGGTFLVNLSDGSARELPDTPPEDAHMDFALDISADGRFAAAYRMAPPEHKGIRVWDLESAKVRVLEESRGRDICRLAFAPDGTLFSSDASGVVSRWDLREQRRTTFAETGQTTVLALSPNGRYLLVTAGPLGHEAETDALTHSTLYDLEEGTSRPFTSHGERILIAAFDPTSRWIVTGDRQGVVRVGPVTGETPHLLLGHGTYIRSVAVSPDGRWIASSGGQEPGVRLWAMPEDPPLQTLPHEELLARLRAMTNLRAVPDTTSPLGYRLEVGPFPGWATLER